MAKEYFREDMNAEEYHKACEDFVADHFRKGMDEAEYEKACDAFQKACEAKNLPTPLWVRMQLEPKPTVIPPPPELKKELDDIDKEFGFVNGVNINPLTDEEFERSYQKFMKTLEEVEAKEKAEAAKA